MPWNQRENQMREHLATLGAVVRIVLERELPSLGPDWWSVGVLSKLSYQQRATAEENDWSRLNDLDVAALCCVSLTPTGICSGVVTSSGGMPATGSRKPQVSGTDGPMRCPVRAPSRIGSTGIWTR